MSDKEHPARGHSETTALTAAGESKGAVVISGNGMPDGYIPPSASLEPPTQPAQPTQSAPANTGGVGDSAHISINGVGTE